MKKLLYEFSAERTTHVVRSSARHEGNNKLTVGHKAINQEGRESEGLPLPPPSNPGIEPTRGLYAQLRSKQDSVFKIFVHAIMF